MTAPTAAVDQGHDSVETQLAYVGLTLLVVRALVEGAAAAAFGWSVGRSLVEALAGVAIGVVLAIVVFFLRGALVHVLFGAAARGVRSAPAVQHLMTLGLGFMGAWWVGVEGLFALEWFASTQASGQVGPVVTGVCGAALVLWAAVRARRADGRCSIMVGAHQLARVLLVLWGLQLLTVSAMEALLFYYSGVGMASGGQFAAAVAMVALAALLVVKRNAVVRVTMGDLGEIASPMPSIGILWGAGLAVLGLWILMWSLPGLLQPFVTDHLPRHLDPDPQPATVGFKLIPWITVLLGVLLVFEGHRLGAVWSGERREVAR